MNQPDSYDDVTRVARPAGWTSDWSKVAIEGRRERLRGFTDEFAAVDLADQPVGVQVDGRLLGSALARAHWELELLRSWESDPRFYIRSEPGAVVPRSSSTEWMSGWRRR